MVRKETIYNGNGAGNAAIQKHKESIILIVNTQWDQINVYSTKGQHPSSLMASSTLVL